MRIFIILGLLLVPLEAVAGIPNSEREALIALYEATGGDAWLNNSGWKSEDGAFSPPGTETDWHGVILNRAGTHVERLSLRGNNLEGTLPPAFKQLTELKDLGLSFNRFPTFPLVLTDMVNLQRFDLSSVGLRDTLPDELGRLVNLTDLDLSGNQLSGDIPTSILQLVNLKRLLLWGNGFVELPDLSPLQELSLLAFGFNNLSGQVPSWIVNLPKLEFVDFSGNAFSGELPMALSQIDQPMHLLLQNNQIERVPFADWGPQLEINLNHNRLTESSCAALKEASERGAKLVFFEQGEDLLYCDVMRLNQTLPWISNVEGQWASEVVLFNPTNQKAFVHLLDSKLGERSLFEIGARELFTPPVRPSNTGYSLQIFSDTDGLVTGYRVGGLRSPSAFSPAMTTGQGQQQGASRLFFPALPRDLQAAMTLTAPLAAGTNELNLRLFGSEGLLATTRFSLEGSEPRAFLIPDLFPDVTFTSDVALEVLAPEGVQVHGTAFAFNRSNEPAMMPAIPAEAVSSDWVLPWAATNEQFVSHVAVFNPGDQDASLTLTATDRDGVQQIQTRTVSAGQHRSFETGDLFPALRGYAIRVLSHQIDHDQEQPVIVNIQVGNREARPTGPSPALTVGLDHAKLTPVVALPLVNVTHTPAIVLQAPNLEGSTEVVLLLGTRSGIDMLDHVHLEGNQPLPILIKDLLPEFHRGPALIMAQSVEGIPLAGTVFDFNDFREPSMAQGLNQAWSDLGLALAYQSDGEARISVVVENAGPFPFEGEAEVVLEMDGQHLATVPVDQPLGLGERLKLDLANLTLPSEDFQQSLVAKLRPVANFLDRGVANNLVRLRPDRHIKVGASARLGQTDGEDLTGIIFADETELEVPIRELVLPAGETLTFFAESLTPEPFEDFRNPAYQFKFRWELEPVIQPQWDPEAGTLRVSGLEPGAVYRIYAEIQDPSGEDHRFPNLVTLSRSDYNASAFKLFGSRDDEIRPTRVYHPFHRDNWLPGAYLSRKQPTGSTGDRVPDHRALQAMNTAMRTEMTFDNTEQYVMELPEGMLHMGIQVFSFSPPLNTPSLPPKLVFHGQGIFRTLIADLDLRPVNSRENHFFHFTNRMSFDRFAELEVRDFALWGAVPETGPVMDVSGRPLPLQDGTSEEPYRWFALGMSIFSNEKVLLKRLDFRFHSIALQLRNNLISTAGSNTQIFLEDLRFAYGDSGILLRNQHHTKVGPHIQVYHMSRQGIFANDVSHIDVEGMVIDGARHRGINFDRASRIWIRDNEISNAGQSGIHLGGDVHFAAVTNNLIQTVNRDRPNPFGDQNSLDGTILSYRPLYEGIKSVRGKWGDSDHLYIAGNRIEDVANGIAIVQGNASDILIENNTIEAWQRGIRLEYGKARLLIDEGVAFEGFLKNLFVMQDNAIRLTDPISTDDAHRHGILFPDADPSCAGCNIDFLESYGRDLGVEIAYYPFPIEFSSYDACGDVPNADCRQWLSNAEVENVGPVYLPPVGENDYVHPSATVESLDMEVLALADALRQTILDVLIP